MHPQVLTYDIDEVVPYINWLYFYHAWGMSGKPLAEKQRLRDEASAMMQSWQGRYRTHAVFALYAANADMDDLLLYADDTADAGSPAFLCCASSIQWLPEAPISVLPISCVLFQAACATG